MKVYKMLIRISLSFSEPPECKIQRKSTECLMKYRSSSSNHTSVQTTWSLMFLPPACETHGDWYSSPQSPADTTYLLASRVDRSLSGSRRSLRWPRLVSSPIYS